MVYSKSMPTDLEKLAKLIKTKTTKSALFDQLALLSTELLNNQPCKLANLNKIYSTIHNVLTTLNYGSDTQIDQPIINKIRALAESLDEIVITTTTEDIYICEWVLENVSTTAIVNYDKEISRPTGGVKLTYKGWYRDYSMEKLIKTKVYG